MNDHLQTLRERAAYLAERIAAKRKVGWEWQYDERERAALTWAIEWLEHPAANLGVPTMLREEDGRWIGEVPDLPGVLAYGSTEAEARARVTALALRVIADNMVADECSS